MKKALIFGGNGYVGSHLKHSLKQKGIEVISLDLEKKEEDEQSFCVDIAKKEDVKNIDFKVDYIFVFSGLTGTEIGFERYKEFTTVNEIGLLNILDHYVQSNSQAHIIFPSTRLVYKGQKDKILKENDEKEALTIYAQNKLTCESLLKIYANRFNIKYTVFRLCVIYGNLLNNKYSYGTIGFFLKNALNSKDITLYEGGNIKRTFVHVSDISEIMYRSLDNKNFINQIFNIGGDHYSLHEVASKIAEKYNVSVKSIPFPEIAKKIESGDTMFDDTKMQNELNYVYNFNVLDWIKELKVIAE